jgi:hypothetical protein
MSEESIKVKGMFRVKIVNPDGTFAGDSGWQENNVMNLGFNKYIVMSLGSITGSLYISHMALGTGGSIATDQTALAGEVGTRTAVTAATSNTSKALNLTATFASSWHSSAAAHAISNIGLFNSLSAGSLFAANTYASSTCASNQAVQASYVISFS